MEEQGQPLDGTQLEQEVHLGVKLVQLDSSQEEGNIFQDQEQPQDIQEDLVCQLHNNLEEALQEVAAILHQLDNIQED